MTKFTFRLEGILEIKRKLEKQAEMEFAAVKARLNAEEDKLLQLRQRQRDCEERLQSLMLDVLDFRKIRLQHDAVDAAREGVEKQKLSIKRVQKQVDLAAAKLNTLMQERKSMEKLREKEFEAYKKEYSAEMSKEVDELISYKHASGGDE